MAGAIRYTAALARAMPSAPTAADVRSNIRCMAALPDPWLGPHAPAATADDILACFRLILGRPPNREEWTGHLGNAGQELGAVVANYVATVLRRVLRPGTGMLDLGANIGVFALLGAALVGASGRVLALEPNPANARLLRPAGWPTASPS